MKIIQTFIRTVCSLSLIVSLVLLAGPAWGGTNTGGTPLCLTTTGSTIDTTDPAFPYGCSGTPSTYTVTMYRLGLCTSDPAPTDGTTDSNGNPGVSPTVTLNYSSCTFALDSAGGIPTDLSAGGSINLGTAPAFPIGSYSYGVMIVTNATSVSTTQSFSTAVVGTNSSSGTFCSTNGGSTYLTTAPLIDVSPEGSTKYLTKCGNTVPAVSATTVILDTFDNSAATQPVVGTIAITPPGSPTGDLLYAFLRRSDNVTVPTGTAGTSTATRLIGVYKFKTAVSVTSATTSFKVNTIVTGGAGFGGGSVSGGVGTCPGSNCYVNRILGGPFIAYITAN